MIEKEKYQKKIGLFGRAGRDLFQYFHSICSSQNRVFTPFQCTYEDTDKIAQPANGTLKEFGKMLLFFHIVIFESKLCANNARNNKNKSKPCLAATCFESIKFHPGLRKASFPKNGVSSCLEKAMSWQCIWSWLYGLTHKHHCHKPPKPWCCIGKPSMWNCAVLWPVWRCLTQGQQQR